MNRTLPAKSSRPSGRSPRPSSGGSQRILEVMRWGLVPFWAKDIKGGGLMALAGLWENWRAPSSGERVRSFAIVTTQPNELCAALHNRMPVVLAPEAWPQWLGEEPVEEAQLKALLAPYPGVLAGQPARRQRQEQRSGFAGADRFAVIRLRPPVMG